MTDYSNERTFIHVPDSREIRRVLFSHFAALPSAFIAATIMSRLGLISPVLCGAIFGVIVGLIFTTFINVRTAAYVFSENEGLEPGPKLDKRYIQEPSADSQLANVGIACLSLALACAVLSWIGTIIAEQLGVLRDSLWFPALSVTVGISIYVIPQLVLNFVNLRRTKKHEQNHT